VIIAFDLDGTLANIEHRLHFIKGDDKPKDWRSFFAACVYDEPITTLLCLVRELATGNYIEVWSGRSDEIRPQTEFWLAQHGLKWAKGNRLRMRKSGDYRPDHVVKAEWLDAIDPPERPHLAFDDRQQVVDMWRSKGVLCCQVAPGDF